LGDKPLISEMVMSQSSTRDAVGRISSSLAASDVAATASS
jgi:hypothetical protein